MKKFVSILCSIAMLFSLSTAAFATEVETTIEPAMVTVTSVANANNDISLLAESRGLLYIEDGYVVANPNGQYNNLGTVKPDAGATLRIWVRNSGGPLKIRIMSMKGIPKVVFDEKFELGERDWVITTNCTGGNYVIGVDGADKAITNYALLLYQN